MILNRRQMMAGAASAAALAGGGVQAMSHPPDDNAKGANTGATYVLVHGAWCGGWIWQQVFNILAPHCRRVYTPTLTGLGDRSHLLSPDIHLSTHIADVSNLIKWERLSNIVLVGHSYGGMVISGVAEKVPQGAIGSIVYLDAVVPEDGDRVAGENNPLDFGTADPIPPPPMVGDDQRLTPQPRATMFEPIRLTGARERVPVKTFIWASGTPAFRRYYEKLKSDPTWRTETLPCGHDAMQELPEETAAALLRASQS